MKVLRVALVGERDVGDHPGQLRAREHDHTRMDVEALGDGRLESAGERQGGPSPAS